MVIVTLLNEIFAFADNENMVALLLGISGSMYAGEVKQNLLYSPIVSLILFSS